MSMPKLSGRYLYNGLNQRVNKSGPTGLVPTGAVLSSSK